MKAINHFVMFDHRSDGYPMIGTITNVKAKDLESNEGESNFEKRLLTALEEHYDGYGRDISIGNLPDLLNDDMEWVVEITYIDIEDGEIRERDINLYQTWLY